MPEPVVIERATEYFERVNRLTRPPRSLSQRAAEVVISAAMFGKGCIDAKYKNERAADVIEAPTGSDQTDRGIGKQEQS